MSTDPTGLEGDPVLSALMRLAQADFSVRVPRTFRGDRDDTLAYLLNLMAEELSRLVDALTEHRAQLEAAVEEFAETLLRHAAGDFSARAKRLDDGSPLDVLAFVINNSGGEVGRLFEERNRAYEDLRQARETEATNRAKSQFLANVSHELRTPLTLILGPLRAALQRPADLPEPLRDDLAIALRNASRLALMVNDLLDFTKVEAGKLEVRWQMVDLGGIVRDVVRDVGPLARARRIALSCRVDGALPDAAVSDRRMVEKIVMNLVGNALKFTRAGGRVDVSLAAEGGRVALRVADTGIGIAREHVERVFERFQQVDSSYTRQFEGTGLGLALVKEFAVALGGEVSVESEVDAGSTFTVRLPLRVDRDQVLPGDLAALAASDVRQLGVDALPPAPELEPPQAHPPPPGPGPASGPAVGPVSGPAVGPASGPRSAGAPAPTAAPALPARPRPYVLLAEDNADMRRYVASVLGREFEVRAVADGQYAIEAIAERVPDVVVSDVMMPRLSGFDVVRHVKGDPRLANVPVLLLTARAGSGEVTEGLDAGADDYLPKPFSPHELVARVRAAARLHATGKQLALTLDELQITKRQLARVDKASYAARLLGHVGRRLRDELASGAAPERVAQTAAELTELERLIEPPPRHRFDLLEALGAAFAPRQVRAEAAIDLALDGERDRFVGALGLLLGRLEGCGAGPVALRVRSDDDRTEIVASIGGVGSPDEAPGRFSPSLLDEASLDLDALRAATAHVCLLNHGVDAELEADAGGCRLRLRLLFV
ncbi:MAG TPA: ATP-binding protein [Polyangiaceae bacterium]|nr:ATP-binding protein [Polyangiaceae bacterium]